MGQIRNSQIRNNDLTGRSVNRNFKFFDEQELPINKGEKRFWQGSWWETKQDLTTAETGGGLPVEGDTSYSPDLQPDYWRELPNYGKQRYVFESLAIEETGLTSANLNDKWFVSMAARMCNNFDSYTNCLFDVHTGTTKWEGLQFTTEAEFITWWNTNVGGIRGTVEIYGNIDQAGIPFHKIYGRNNGLSIMKGSNATGQSQYNLGRSLLESNWDNKAAFANDVIQRVTGVAPSVDVTPVVHFTSSTANKYHLYPTLTAGPDITFEGGIGTKLAYNPATDSTEVIHNSSVFSSVVGANAFYSIDISNGAFHFEGVQHILDSRYLLDNRSLVKAYAFRNNSGHVIVIVKPVGQDLFHLNWVGPLTGVSLFAGFYNKNAKLQVRRLPNDAILNNFTGHENSNISYWVAKKALLLGQSSVASYGLSRNKLRNIVLFYMDTKGNMSPLSHEISWVVNAPGAKAYCLCKKNS